jgi:hypothetical protein
MQATSFQRSKLYSLAKRLEQFLPHSYVITTSQMESCMSGKVDQFLGDSIGRTIIKLLVISFVVGVVMAAMDWSPFDIFYGIRDFIIRIWHQGFAALGRFGEYLALGAAVVIPVFILLRILNYRNR